MTKFQLAHNLAIAKRRTDRTQWNGDGRGGGERKRERRIAASAAEVAAGFSYGGVDGEVRGGRK